MAERLYEGMFLFDANLAGRDWPGLEQHVADLLKRNSAELVYAERWPDRKLAYEIKGCKKGTYYLTYFRGPSDSIQGLERDCQLSERVLRLLVVYDEALEEDCRKRVNREIQGSPEEIEERRERGAAAAAAAASASAPSTGDGPPAASPAAEAGSAVSVAEEPPPSKSAESTDGEGTPPA